MIGHLGDEPEPLLSFLTVGLFRGREEVKMLEGESDKLEAVKKILIANERVKSDDEGIYDKEPEMWTHYVSEDDYDAVARQLYQLFQLKLPENPYPARPFGNLGTEIINLKYQVFDEAIQKVKELNK